MLYVIIEQDAHAAGSERIVCSSRLTEDMLEAAEKGLCEIVRVCQYVVRQPQAHRWAGRDELAHSGGAMEHLWEPVPDVKDFDAPGEFY